MRSFEASILRLFIYVTWKKPEIWIFSPLSALPIKKVNSAIGIGH